MSVSPYTICMHIDITFQSSPPSHTHGCTHTHTHTEYAHRVYRFLHEFDIDFWGKQMVLSLYLPKARS